MASTSDAELEYLTPGFDPTTLTVAKLRNILVSHDVTYPSSAKKPQLIELFQANVVPLSRRILGSRSRTKRTSRGITDAESSQDGSIVGAEDASLMPPPAVTPRRRSPKKSGTRASTEESADDGPAPTTAARKASAKHARTSDAEAELPRPAVRKARKSETPAVKVEDTEQTPDGSAGDDSVFSHDNPFQSGSSPLSGDTKDTRRKSTGASTSRDGARRKSGTARRKTDMYARQKAPKVEDGIAMPSSRTFDIPVARLQAPAPDAAADDGVEAGEEFTPEAQRELTREQLKGGARDVVPTRRTRTGRGAGRVSRSAPWVVLLTLLVGFATWWRQEKLKVGYCGVGQASTSIANVEIPDWLGFLQAECEPCPPHAYCYPDLLTTCEGDFVLRPHPLSLGGLVPLAPTCEPDGEKVRKVKAVADRAVEELRDVRARFECGEPADDAGGGKGAPPATAQVDEDALKREVGKKRRRGMSQAEFEELWRGAVDEMAQRDEVVGGVDGITGRRTLTSTSLARLPLACAARRSARLALARYRVELAGLMVLLVLVGSARRHLRSLSDAKARVPELVKLTLDRLATQAALHAQDGRAVPEPWVLVGQLRDDVLRDEFSPQRREGLWRRVRDVVELNANVRARVTETRGGEVGRVWEWIGSVGALEEAASGAGRRDSGRLSLGAHGGSATPTPAPEDGRRQEVVQRGWQEGRPIY
ncbi:MAG: inner nuclear membrane protein enriched at telomere/subtelomere region [Thelocarpon impressellum]|nr:MAG: inner nuclear membrane protein enriched at telomere/subtelomere region [Thelocarpon impressellum]